MKILLIVPEVRMDEAPYTPALWSGILGAIAEKKGAEVGLLDLNALRMNYSGNLIPLEKIEEEISTESWDLVGIGGLTTTYSRMKEIIPLIHKNSPNSIIIAGGGWVTYNPDEIMQLIPEIDLTCIGEGEETFSEVLDEVQNKTYNFSNIDGLCIRKEHEFEYTPPRALISDLNQIPYPAYHLYENDIYFRYSSQPHSAESMNAKRRMAVVWERGCPRGCTFCSHNGMSRGDQQNILGKGDKRKGEKLTRIVDEKYDTFQLPARWPTPEYAVENVKFLHEKFGIDFLTIMDENMTSNAKWTEAFCSLYVKEGLDKKVKWGTLGDAPSVATKPHLVKLMKNAGCCYISFGFESASDKVLNDDIKKGQTQAHLQKTIDTIKEAGLRPITTFMIGNAHENIDDLMETMMFWIKNGILIDPFICTPYVGSPIFYDNKDYILEQYDERIKILNTNPNCDKKLLAKLKLRALDKFMAECGNATDYTATISQYFTIPELFAIKRLMYKQDFVRLLRMAHQRYEQTGLEQWNHSKKWSKYCNICKSREELLDTPQIQTN